MEPLVVIIGPSAVGKTEIALQIALRKNAEIISADSTLIYRGLNIGTAKPPIIDRKRVPHHLIDIVNPDQNYSLAEFQREANRIITDIHSRGRLAILVGGTGQYVRAITDVWEIPEVPPDISLRVALRNWLLEIGQVELYRRLIFIDPIAASKIDYRNSRRIIRALEVIFKTGVKFSDQRKKGISRYHILKIGLSLTRNELYKRVDQRIEQMVDKGLFDEVASLLKKGYSPDLPCFSAIGYKEAIYYLQGKISIDEAKAAMKKRTRIFIRHQANWFKLNDPSIRWFLITPNIIEEIQLAIEKWLEQPCFNS